MKRFVTALFASALLATSPAWAGGGHGHDKDEDKHAGKEWKKERKAWEKEQKHWAKHGGRHDEYVVNHYYEPAPPVVYPYYAEPVRYSPPPALQVIVRLPLN
jgi:hypothetical protein